MIPHALKLFKQKWCYNYKIDYTTTAAQDFLFVKGRIPAPKEDGARIGFRFSN